MRIASAPVCTRTPRSRAAATQPATTASGVTYPSSGQNVAARSPRRLEPGHELGGLRDRDLPGRNVELGLEAERPAEERHVLWASSRNR